jgi:hypothetical protein
MNNDQNTMKETNQSNSEKHSGTIKEQVMEKYKNLLRPSKKTILNRLKTYDLNDYIVRYKALIQEKVFVEDDYKNRILHDDFVFVVSIRYIPVGSAKCKANFKTVTEEWDVSKVDHIAFELEYGPNDYTSLDKITNNQEYADKFNTDQIVLYYQEVDYATIKMNLEKKAKELLDVRGEVEYLNISDIVYTDQCYVAEIAEIRLIALDKGIWIEKKVDLANQITIDNEPLRVNIEDLVSNFKKITKLSGFPYMLTALIYVIFTIFFFIQSLFANPIGIEPLHNGMYRIVNTILGNSLFQSFLFVILPVIVVFLVFKRYDNTHKLPTLHQIRKNIFSDKSPLVETAIELGKRGKMKRKIMVVFFSIILVFTIASSSYKLEEIKLYTTDDIKHLTEEDQSKRIVLMNDIHFDGYSGKIFEKFTGVFEGNGYTISGLEFTGIEIEYFFNNDKVSSPAIFGLNYGTIANVNFEDVLVQTYHSASIVTIANHGTIINVSVNQAEIQVIGDQSQHALQEYSAISLSNYGLIQDVSVKDVTYTIQEPSNDSKIHRVSLIATVNEGMIKNVYAEQYTINDLSYVSEFCISSCEDIYDRYEEGSIENINVYVGDTVDFYDIDSVTICDFNCLDTFDLETTMVDTPTRYYQIKLEEE